MSATFSGYPRPDGSVGARNHVLVLPGGWECQQIVSMVSGTVTPNSSDTGTARTRRDRATIARVRTGLALNPNTFGVVALDTGIPDPDELAIGNLVDACRAAGKPVELIDTDGFDGIARGARAATRMVQAASSQRRVEAGAENLSVGVKCGASDPTSGVAGNPTVGRMFDRVVAAGGSALFSETTEVIGAEHELAKRCVSDEVRERFLSLVADQENMAAAAGQDIRTINPGPANITAGISTLEEKSLGAVHKAGSAPIAGVLDWAERPNGQGLYFMDSAASYSVVLPGLAGAGCNVVLFQVGGGGWNRSALTSGLGIVAPQLWVTGNPATAEKLADSIDFSAGAVFTEGRSIGELGDELFDLVLDTASGKLTRTEMLRFFDPVQYYLVDPAF